MWRIWVKEVKTDNNHSDYQENNKYFTLLRIFVKLKFYILMKKITFAVVKSEVNY